MFRYRKNTKNYRRHTDELCPFCYPKPENILSETTHSRVIKNLFPYDHWEYRTVTEHYMVIPKRHVRSLNELKPVELADLMSVIAEYEGKNFNIYARSSNSVERTVPLHQHTHLIKTDTKHARAALYLRKPYISTKI